jgi:hypothetical protein
VPQSRREAIRQTVVRAVPNLEIDTTRVLTDEEMEALKAQMAARVAAKKLADQEGREALLARLKRTVEKCVRQDDLPS